MWYEQSRWRQRLAAEQLLMESRFPQFVLRRQSNGNLFWEGILEPVPEWFFRVSIAYPLRYPYEEPHLRVLEPPIEPGTPHIYTDGRICVHRANWNPETGTATSMVPVLAGWLLRYVNRSATAEEF